ncbi:hypothetical protein RJT34_12648 [Clitoria ternatea]|uniref:Uncharacterized protein n=1 Tax=Clitoria ternatea TaxID=43366 RepID=A0AAN9PKY4_CLITE
MGEEEDEAGGGSGEPDPDFRLVFWNGGSLLEVLALAIEEESLRSASFGDRGRVSEKYQLWRLRKSL